MSTRVLFLVNGLGLGNATRCHAVMQRLVDHGATVEAACSGNGFWYLDGREELAEVHELEALRYGSTDGALSVWGTLMAAGEHLGVLRRNDDRVAAIVERFKPDVAVIDSVYSVRALRRAGVPIVALNNSDVVHASWHAFGDRPSSARAQFYAIEESDRRFHTWMADAVTSPSLDPNLAEVGAPFRRVGPIVRRGVQPRPMSGPVRRLLVMLSGSVFGSPVALSKPLEGVHIDVVGRDRPESVPAVEGIAWHGKVRDNLELLAAADLAVVNGGFSAVSELFCLRTPLVVLPVPNHAEQWVNARTIEHLGVGTIGSDATLTEDIARALPQVEGWREAYAALPEPSDGAGEAATIILEVGTR